MSENRDKSKTAHFPLKGYLYHTTYFPVYKGVKRVRRGSRNLKLHVPDAVGRVNKRQNCNRKLRRLRTNSTRSLANAAELGQPGP